LFRYALVKALAASSTQHANYERVLAGVVQEVPLSSAAVTVGAYHLLTIVHLFTPHLSCVM
jgi:hypothetical protein